MNQDISFLLNDWPYDSQNSIRIVKKSEGKEVLQVRKPMGIEQYELEGRPDGKRPFGKDAVLSEYQERLSEHRRIQGSDKNFVLHHEDFLLLQEEALFFYYRYLILFQMGDMERTVRDTDHNLKISALLENYCPNEDDRIQLLQYKPYILRINAVARSMVAMKQQLNTVAVEIVEDAISEIRNLPEINNMTFQFEKIRSLNYLKVTLSQLDDSKTIPILDQLKLELEDAVKLEDYEKAAEIRDKIQEISHSGENS
jgi:tetratricopeptide (TPR) repeat protein